MLFNSFQFLLLVAITLPLYYALGGTRWARLWQVTLLLIASAVFYAWGNPALLPLLAFSCLLNAVSSGRILHFRHRENEARAKLWMQGAVVINLLLLAVFKYAGFLAGLLPDSVMPADWLERLKSIPLPVGISFYTFQGISLVVDVWRRDISKETEAMLSREARDRFSVIRETSFYVAFFPQLVAGPIVKAHEFFDQIGVKRWASIDWITVRRCLILGYFLKIFVADNLAEQTAILTVGDEALEATGPIGLMAMLYGYGLQIFADFAGYSLIAIGLGALFGYRLPPNFNFPYLSTSITEFWRRWHLSLSSWLRDYLYFPLGGNRKGPGRTYINLFLVMFLGGLWHGAEWKFALWGSLHGGFLALERFGGSLFPKNDQPQSRITGALKNGLRWFYTFHVVTFLWLTFLMPDMAHIIGFFKALTADISVPGQPIFALLIYGGAVVAYHLWGWLNEHRRNLADTLSIRIIEGGMHALMIFLILTNPGAPRGFIYFQF